MTKATDKPGSARSEDLREKAEQTREELGGTVAQLAAKADVKKRAQDKLDEVRDEVKETAAHAAQVVREHTPQPVRDAAAKAVPTGRRKPVAAIGASLAGMVALTATVLRRRSKNSVNRKNSKNRKNRKNRKS